MIPAGWNRDVSTLVPHREPALLLREVVSFSEGKIECEGSVPDDGPYVHEGLFPAFLMLELAAQCSAALEALEGMARGGEATARPGYLVRARRVEMPQPRLRAGETFRVRVERTGRAGELHMYRAEAASAGEPIFAGSFSTFVPQDA